MGIFNGSPLPEFIKLSDVLTENFDEELTDDTSVNEEEPVVEDPATEEGTSDESGAEGAAEGEPEILKVYSASEEDIQELIDNGIDLGTGEDENAEPTLPEDGLYIKIKTIEGEEVILLFKERDPQERTPAEDEDLGEEGTEGEEAPVTESFGEETFEDTVPEEETSEVPVEGEGTEEPTEEVPTEGRFDTELVAQHNDYEYAIPAEIEVSAEGEVEDIDIEEEDETGEPQVEATPADETEETEDEEFPVTESRVMKFSDFINRGK
jgi:hypothetical protein